MSVEVGTALPPDVTSIDVLLRPSTDKAEETAGVQRIWGKPIERTGVPLKRFDIAPAPPPIE